MALTKQQEIDILDGMIWKLGSDSYLGPYFKHVRDSVVSDIRNDFPVDVLMPHVAERQAADTIAAAKQEAARIIADAKKQATDALNSAYERMESERELARQELRMLANRI